MIRIPVRDFSEKDWFRYCDSSDTPEREGSKKELLHLCETQSPTTAAIEARPFSGTEFSWCKAVPEGTGITVLGLILSKSPQILLLQKALHSLQTSHPVLHYKLHHDPSDNTFHFLTRPTPTVQIHPFDLPSIAQILQAQAQDQDNPFHVLLHYQMSFDTWHNSSDSYVFHRCRPLRLRI
ncbi:hypothetical protein Fmac_015823 [Flemingia macrophylla]|uniref:Uncharacterized protein n=1 Tax=Flemingia macrophylla TaxID=520843 RepID=A0ABD1MHS2_9FABA